MDVSEEMEEVRELLYEMIKKNFPMGVSSSHLAQKYHEEYVSKGLGRELPEDWLVQVAEAEEFEAQTRGPLTILFVRLSNTTSYKRAPIPNTDVKVMTSGSMTAEAERVKLRKDRHPLQHAETLSTCSTSLQPKCDVIVVAFESSRELYIRAVADDPVFDSMKTDMRKFYAENSSDRRVQIYELPRSGTIKCFFCDVGVYGVYPVVDLRLLPDPGHPIMCRGALAKRVNLALPDYAIGQASDDILRSVLFEKDAMGNFIPVRVQLTSLTETELDGEIVSIADLWMTDGRAVVEIVMTNIPDGKEGNNGVNNDATSSTRNAPAAVSLPPTVCVFDGDVEIDPMPDYMYGKLSEESQMADAELQDPPRPGAFYAARIDDRWERVQCVRASKIDKSAFCVYLIDVGAFHYVRADALRRLNAKTPFRKMLMFKCKVANIVPVGGQDIWNRESHEAVREFFEASLGETVMVTPIPNGCGVWKQLNAPAVPFVTANISCCGRDLADWLISHRLAIPGSN
ncbi:tudor domain protein, partial [Ostertagia ostertagi]